MGLQRQKQMVCKLSFLFNSCKYQETKIEGRFALKEISLEAVEAKPYHEFLIIPLEKSWLKVNNEKPLIFEVKITKNGKLELSSRLAALDSSKEVDINAR